jgi:hypothetical protein
VKKSRYFIIILLLPAFVISCKTDPEHAGITSTKEVEKLFTDPPAGYRSVPFWNWNDIITMEGIDFQMEEFKKAGIGGVFVHPRPGLINEYLSDDWFQLFDYCVKKGKELGINVWIYDENSYPSGFAGGHVPAEMPGSYQHGTGLKMEVRNNLNFNFSGTIEVVLQKNNDEFIDITSSLNLYNNQQGTYYIFRKTYPQKSLWYGGFPYVDLLHQGVTEKFIDITMSRGYERNKPDFGGIIPGIFTDEPNPESALAAGSSLRWTPDLWIEFGKRWNYDLRKHLPSLIEEIGNWKKVRHDYYSTLLDLFIERWAKPYSNYCKKNNLIWTGHYHEHGWPEPTLGFDEAAMYLFHDQPGVDMLGSILDTAGLGIHCGNDRAIRELRSVANQTGSIRTLSESYGGGGWDFGFETQKRLVDWQFALGVNFINQHMSDYSLTGVRKYDYPLSFSYHESWWKHYRLMGDYIGRMSLAMSGGEQINEILVIQPNTTAWMYFTRKENNPVIYSIRDDFKSFIYQLEQNHIEYDLGSEYVLKVSGSAAGNKLKVGKRDYSLIVIPAEMENLESSTVSLLKKYLENGGRIISFNPNITLVDGEMSEEVNELASGYPEQWLLAENLNSQAARILFNNEALKVKIKNSGGMFYHHRRILEDGQLILFVNSHPGEKANATIEMEGKYVNILDCISGGIFKYPSEQNNGKVKFAVNLFPSGSALFMVTDKKSKHPDYVNPDTADKSLKSVHPVTVKRESDNLLPVIYLDIKTAKSEKRETYFMNIVNSLYRENGIETGNPWFYKIQYKNNYMLLDSLFNEKSGFEASYHFFISEDIDKSDINTIRAVVERAGLWDVKINGIQILPEEGEFCTDTDFLVYPVGPYLDHGQNTLTIHLPKMHILAEVMPIYIIGDFLVKPGSTGYEITGGDIDTTGSWRDNGLPFYSNAVIYSQVFNLPNPGSYRYKVKQGKWKGIVAEVIVNGHSAGLIAWPPYELEVTKFINKGSNEISVKIYGSLQNTFGPFFEKSMQGIYPPFLWNVAPEKPPSASEYRLEEYGLFSPFELTESD